MKNQIVALLALFLFVGGCMPMGSASGISIPSRPGQISPVVNQPRPDAPQLKRLPNGHYRVVRPWAVTIGGKTWQVQKGYTSNGITAPSRIKSTLGDGISHKETWAAVFHDWLFTQPGVSRAQADRIFHDLMIAYGVSEMKANLMYRSVSTYSMTKR